MSAIVVGNAESVLRKLPEGLAQACITSPPYWGLRDYSLTQQIGSEEKLSTYLGRLARIFGVLEKHSGLGWRSLAEYW